MSQRQLTEQHQQDLEEKRQQEHSEAEAIELTRIEAKQDDQAQQAQEAAAAVELVENIAQIERHEEEAKPTAQARKQAAQQEEAQLKALREQGAKQARAEAQAALRQQRYRGRTQEDVAPIKLIPEEKTMVGVKALLFGSSPIPMTPATTAMGPMVTVASAGNVVNDDNNHARRELLGEVVSGSGVGEAKGVCEIICGSFAALIETHMGLGVEEIEAVYRLEEEIRKAYGDEPDPAKQWEMAIVRVAGLINAGSGFLAGVLRTMTLPDKYFFYTALELIKDQNPAKKAAGVALFFLYFNTTFPLKQWAELGILGLTHGTAAATSLAEGVLSARSWHYKAKKFTESMLYAARIMPQLTLACCAISYHKEINDLLKDTMGWYADTARRFYEAAKDGHHGAAAEQLGKFFGSYLTAGAMAYFTQAGNALSFHFIADPLAQRFNKWLKPVVQAAKAAGNAARQEAQRVQTALEQLGRPAPEAIDDVPDMERGEGGIRPESKQAHRAEEIELAEVPGIAAAAPAAQQDAATADAPIHQQAEAVQQHRDDAPDLERGEGEARPQQVEEIELAELPHRIDAAAAAPAEPPHELEIVVVDNEAEAEAPAAQPAAPSPFGSAMAFWRRQERADAGANPVPRQEHRSDNSLGV